MRKVICLFFALSIMVLVKAQHNIHCGSQMFTITAKKIYPVKQVDFVTKAATVFFYYYFIGGTTLKVWLTTGDSLTRSFTLYEIEKSAIDKKISGEIVEYDQQDYTASLKTLFIKCLPGKKDVQVTNYVDWADKTDKFPWSFISVSTHSMPELEKILTEINNWLTTDTK